MGNPTLAALLKARNYCDTRLEDLQRKQMAVEAEIRAVREWTDDIDRRYKDLADALNRYGG